MAGISPLWPMGSCVTPKHNGKSSTDENLHIQAHDVYDMYTFLSNYNAIVFVEDVHRVHKLQNICQLY
jgi:hypothetical protein